MVDFRTSGVPKGGLGIYSATRNLQSVASSSLDKPAGTLSSKSVQQAGAEAQKLINVLGNREVTKDTNIAERSYSYSQGLQTSDFFAVTQENLINKFVAQATPQQQLQLIQESGSLGIGQQKAIMEIVSEQEKSQGFDFKNILLIGGALFLLSGAKL